MSYEPEPEPSFPAWRAVWAFFVDGPEFARLAVADADQFERLVNKGYASQYATGLPREVADDHVIAWRARLGKARRNLWESFGVTLGAGALAVTLAWLVGAIAPALPMGWNKLWAALGGGLAAWSTLFYLGHTFESMGGQSLLERVRPLVFTVIFVPGTLMVLLGAVL